MILTIIIYSKIRGVKLMTGIMMQEINGALDFRKVKPRANKLKMRMQIHLIKKEQERTIRRTPKRN